MSIQADIHLRKEWSAGRDRSGGEVIFVLGAGASRDANLPLAAEVTEHWRRELCQRVGGARKVLEAIDRVRMHADSRALEDHDGDEDLRAVADDYEDVFWWLHVLFERPALRRLAELDSRAYEHSYLKIVEESRDIITALLHERERAGGDVAYLTRVVEFASKGKPVQVFTLNYDTCVERACRARKIPVITGFGGTNVRRRGWQPDLFRRETTGVHLFKLHGSLTWFGSDPNIYEDLEPIPARPQSPRDARPHLILGPVSKVQADDPFWWLLDRFHSALQRARTCVIIGFRGRDPHITRRISHERSLGLDVVEVGPGVQPAPEPTFGEPKEFERGSRLGVDRTACDALTNGRIHDALRHLAQLRNDARHG